jgi:O2-independent ubiquinone biosynthesis accessory factor UbiT
VATTALLIPLRLALAVLITKLLERNPALGARLGPHAGSAYLIEPSDLPIVLRLIPDRRQPVLEPYLRGTAPACDARITGRLRHLIALVSGDADGDALFFSRDLAFSGDTEAVLALRNALDATRFDLVMEIESLLGPAAAPLRSLRHGAGVLEHIAARLQRRMLRPVMARIERLERELGQWRDARDDRERRLLQRQQSRRHSATERTIDVHAGT